MYPNSPLKIAIFFVFLNAAFVLQGGAPYAFAAEIIFKNQQLSLEAHEESLGGILKQLNKKTGVIFHYGSETAKFKTTIRFKKLPLTKALARLLSNHNYVLVLDKNQKPKDLHILAPLSKNADTEKNETIGQGVGDGNFQNPYPQDNNQRYQDPNTTPQEQSETPDPYAQEQAENENQEESDTNEEEQMEKRQPRYPGAPGNPVDQFKQQ